MTEITRQQMVEFLDCEIKLEGRRPGHIETQAYTMLKAIRAALTEKALPECRKCGAPACCEIRPTNIPADFTPYCRNCADAEHGTCQSIANHEMQNFGGAYGVPGIEERPIEAARREGE